MRLQFAYNYLSDPRECHENVKFNGLTNLLWKYSIIKTYLYPMKKWIHIFICSLGMQNSWSQSADSLSSSKLILGTSLFEYLPGVFLHTANYNIDAELRLKNQWSLITNLGYIHSFQNYWLRNDLSPRIRFNKLIDPSHGTRIQFEIRRYLGWYKMFEPACLLFWPHMLQYRNNNAINTGYYTAIHGHFRYLFVHHNTLFRKSYEAQGFVTNAAVHLKFGYRNIKVNGLSLDLGIATGLQYYDSDQYYGFVNRMGFFPSFSYQLKLGWVGR